MSNFIKKFRDNNGNEFPLDFNSLRNFPTLQAGQVLKVTAVDADGQPTGWEAGDVTADLAGLGIDATAEEINALDGITGNVQEQIDGKAATGHTHTAADVGAAASDHAHDEYATKASPVFTGSISLGREAGTTVGTGSVAIGYNAEASGNYSHAVGHSNTASGLYSSVEGAENTASGTYAHAEGYRTQATGTAAHAEGIYSIAAGNGAHAEGSSRNTEGGNLGDVAISATTYPAIGDTDIVIKGPLAQGVNSHAEGTQTFAFGYSSHAEGYRADAIGEGSHAEGWNTAAVGAGSHAEGGNVAEGTDTLDDYTVSATDFPVIGADITYKGSLAQGIQSHAEGTQTIAFGHSSHAEGMQTKALGDYSHAEGNDTAATDYYAHAEGWATVASGLYSHAEGFSNEASGVGAHAEGRGSEASGDYSHAECRDTVASGLNTHAEGNGTTASGNSAHAEGYGTTASGDYSHTEGLRAQATKSGAHAEGKDTVASGTYSHAEGDTTKAIGNYSHSEGTYTTADNYAGHAGGKLNKAMATGAALANTTGDAFVVGNGTGSSALSNAFRVTYAGAVYGKASYNSSGADYAEYFEWADGNPDNEDRIGYFVTLDGRKIRKAEAGEYILGIVSGNPCIIGNADEDWLGRWMHDEFGRYITEAAPKIIEEEYTTEDGITDIRRVEVEGETDGWRYKANPDYDPSQPYIERKDRPEWAAIGMMGVLAVRDDGTCEVNGYAKVSTGGTATAAEKFIHGETYRVVERTAPNVVNIIIKC